MERSAHSSFSSSSTLRMLSASTSPAKRRFSCSTVRGSGEERSAASSTRFTCSMSISPPALGEGWAEDVSSSSGDCSGFVCSLMSSGNRQRGALGFELHVDGVEGCLLRDLDHRLAGELEEGEEAHHEERHAALR